MPQDTQLTERSPGIPAWDSLDADHKKVAAHMMEVYAAALSYCDSQMGRIIDTLVDEGELKNTLVASCGFRPNPRLGSLRCP